MPYYIQNNKLFTTKFLLSKALCWQTAFQIIKIINMLHKKALDTPVHNMTKCGSWQKLHALCSFYFSSLFIG